MTGSSNNALKVLLIIVVMLLCVVACYYLFFVPAQTAYEEQKKTLDSDILILNAGIDGVRNDITSIESSIESMPDYTEVLELINAKNEEGKNQLDLIRDSRYDLYSHFPTELREEDQIGYWLDLEQKFGVKIFTSVDGGYMLSFGQIEPVAQLNDGSVLGRVSMTVNYESSYEGFKDMLRELATDEKIASVRLAEMNYFEADGENVKEDTMAGLITIDRYILVVPEYNPELDYTEPEITPGAEPGKTTIYDAKAGGKGE